MIRNTLHIPNHGKAGNRSWFLSLQLSSPVTPRKLGFPKYMRTKITDFLKKEKNFKVVSQ